MSNSLPAAFVLLAIVEHKPRYYCQNNFTLDRLIGECEQQRIFCNSKGCISSHFTSALIEIFVHFYLEQIITLLSLLPLLILGFDYPVFNIVADGRSIVVLSSSEQISRLLFPSGDQKHCDICYLYYAHAYRWRCFFAVPGQENTSHRDSDPHL